MFFFGCSAFVALDSKITKYLSKCKFTFKLTKPRDHILISGQVMLTKHSVWQCQNETGLFKSETKLS